MPRTKIWGLAAIATSAAAGAALSWSNEGAGSSIGPSSGSMALAAAIDYPSQPLGALTENGNWLNSPDLSPEALRGKVVLVNFWTYSCINSLRPLPYIRDRAAKYKDSGLVVVGVHTPEFSFEKDIGKVRRAAANLDVSWPIKLDSDYATWKRFGNNGWPGFYFIDAQGVVRHHRLGEGDYANSERLLQKLLSEVKGSPVTGPLTGDLGSGIEAAPDWESLRSRETYLGYRRADGLAVPQKLQPDVSFDYKPAGPISTNEWDLVGMWTVGGEAARADAGAATIRYRFQARDLHLVLGARRDGKPVRFRVTVDGLAPQADHGADTDANGIGIVTSDRLYQLVRQSGAVKARTFEIEFLYPGARAYAFTFG